MAIWWQTTARLPNTITAIIILRLFFRKKFEYIFYVAKNFVRLWQILNY